MKTIDQVFEVISKVTNSINVVNDRIAGVLTSLIGNVIAKFKKKKEEEEEF